MRKLTRLIILVLAGIALLATSLSAAQAPHDGVYYLKEMKLSIKNVIDKNQSLINSTPSGEIKNEKLTPDAIYERAYEIFSEIAGEDFSVKGLGDDPAKIAQALGTLLQAGRITVAKSQKLINTEQDKSVVLKKFIPAVFGRLVAMDYLARTGVQLKQTTMGHGDYGARNPYNEPDEWEKAALTKIMNSSWERNEGTGEMVDGSYRLLKPIYIKKACLGCHGDAVGSKGPYGHDKEGYSVNDVRGGISILIPVG
jgi:hypothetical protein